MLIHTNKKINFILIISFLIFFISFLVLSNYFNYSLASDSTYVWSNNLENSIQTFASNAENILALESTSAVLIEQTTGQILYSHNMNEQLRPASVTKVMTILLIMEALEKGQISLTDQVPCSETAASMGGSQIWLEPKETLSVDDMLKAICIASANDCSVAMAEFISGSHEAFVELMNQRAKELGMINTTFKNCHGLDEDGHVTSSYDISLMSRELLQNHSEITKYTTTWMDTLRNGESELVNTNKLINSYSGITGLKTGSTGLALYNLSASATRDNLSLIAVVMKAPSTKIRFEEAEKLLNYGFNTYTTMEYAKKGDILKSIPVIKGTNSNVDVVFNSNATILVKKGDEQNIQQIVSMEEELNAPISSNQKVGEVRYVLNNETIYSVDLVTISGIDKKNIFTISKEILYNWFSILRI